MVGQKKNIDLIYRCVFICTDAPTLSEMVGCRIRTTGQLKLATIFGRSLRKVYFRIGLYKFLLLTFWTLQYMIQAVSICPIWESLRDRNRHSYFLLRIIFHIAFACNFRDWATQTLCWWLAQTNYYLDDPSVSSYNDDQITIKHRGEEYLTILC